jgi:hypothetical protein
MLEHLSHMHPAWRWFAGALVVIALAALGIHQGGGPEREVRSLPASERHALYLRTLEILKTTCVHAAGATLLDHCREQAEFIKLFSECDDTCRALVVQLTPSATR